MPTLDELEMVLSARPLSITIEVSPIELEFAIATDGWSLHERLKLAIVAGMAVEAEFPA